MEPKKPRSKTVVLVIIILIVLTGFGSYYIATLRNGDRRPNNVETQSTLIR